jgi:hypothetical protein
MTDGQRDWPRGTLRNERGSPLLRLAAGERAQRDFEHVRQEAIGWSAEFCEDLDAALARVHGDDWLRVLGLEKYAT